MGARKRQLDRETKTVHETEGDVGKENLCSMGVVVNGVYGYYTGRGRVPR